LIDLFLLHYIQKKKIDTIRTTPAKVIERLAKKKIVSSFKYMHIHVIQKKVVYSKRNAFYST